MYINASTEEAYISTFVRLYLRIAYLAVKFVLMHLGLNTVYHQLQLMYLCIKHLSVYYYEYIL